MGWFHPITFPDTHTFVTKTTTTKYASAWQRCPICDGRGNVLYGFYDPHPGALPAHTNSEKCHRCDGDGTILRPEQTKD